MWIFCCGMQRSGSTLQFQITSRLVEDAGLGKRVEWTKPDRFNKLRKKYAAEEGWKVFKNHNCTEKMEREFHRQNAIGVYTYRDLRDVYVSTMRKNDVTFEQLWKAKFLEQCLRQYQQWTSLPRVLTSKYETMLVDLPGEVARIAAHLGLRVDAAKCRQIAEEHDLERQKERIEEAKKSGRLKHGYANAYFDPDTNLHTNHIHSGEVGGWKRVLSDDQVSKIEILGGDWLVANGYELTTMPAAKKNSTPDLELIL